MIKVFITFLFLICLIMSLLTGIKVSKWQKVMIYVFAFLMVLIATFRSEDMPDYSNYYQAIVNANSYDAGRFEPTFNLIRFLAFNVPLVVFFIYACLSIFTRVTQIIKLSPLVWGSMLIYLSNIFILHDMIQIRAAVTSSLLLVALPYHYERRFWPYALVCLIATLFHYSAVVFFLLWFINPKSNQRGLYMGCLLVSYCMAVLGITVTQVISYIPFRPIQLLYYSYSSKVDEFVNVFNLLQLGRCAMCVCLWMVVDRIQEKYTLFMLLIKIYTIALCTLPLFSDIPAVAVRFNQLLLSVEMIMVPSAFYFIIKQNIVAKVLTAFYATVLFVFTITNSQYWSV